MRDTEFRPDENDIEANYVELARSTGESFDSIADRIETQSGDPITADKIRALDTKYPKIKLQQRRDALKAEAAADERAEVEREQKLAAQKTLLESLIGSTATASVDQTSDDDHEKETGDVNATSEQREAAAAQRSADLTKPGDTRQQPPKGRRARGQSTADTGGSLTSTEGGSAAADQGVTASSGTQPAATAAAPAPSPGADSSAAATTDAKPKG